MRILAASLALFVVPLFVLGQGLVPCDGPDCNACHLISLGQNILNFLITVTILIGAIVIAWAGLRLVMSAGNTNQVTAAKSMITNVVVGIVILLAAWLIIDTIMKVPGFVDEGRIGPWNKIECRSTSSFTPQQPSDGSLTTRDGTLDEGQLSHNDAFAELSRNGVVVTSTSGSGGVQRDCITGTGCTSLEGIRTQSVQQAVNIKENCDCDVTITGATEPGHASGEFSHENGFKFDLQRTASLDQFLSTSLTENGERSGENGGTRFVDACGNEYVQEGSHWDVTVSNGSCSL